jgi:hypothetical protein
MRGADSDEIRRRFPVEASHLFRRKRKPARMAVQTATGMNGGQLALTSSSLAFFAAQLAQGLALQQQ